MKIKIIPAIIAFFVSLLIAYGLFHACHYESRAWFLSIVSGIVLFIPMLACIGVSFQPKRTSANIKVVSAVFWVVILIADIIFSFFQFSIPLFIITNCLLLLFWLLISYFIGQAEQ